MQDFAGILQHAGNILLQDYFRCNKINAATKEKTKHLFYFSAQATTALNRVLVLVLVFLHVVIVELRIDC